ncbi:hypothetical protein AKJ16_DCAP12087 [Drosera capensis]
MYYLDFFQIRCVGLSGSFVGFVFFRGQLLSLQHHDFHRFGRQWSKYSVIWIGFGAKRSHSSVGGSDLQL